MGRLSVSFLESFPPHTWPRRLPVRGLRWGGGGKRLRLNGSFWFRVWKLDTEFLRPHSPIAQRIEMLIFTSRVRSCKTFAHSSLNGNKVVAGINNISPAEVHLCTYGVISGWSSKRALRKRFMFDSLTPASMCKDRRRGWFRPEACMQLYPSIQRAW